MQTISSDPARFHVTSLNNIAHTARWRTEAMRSYQGAVLLWFQRGEGRITVNGVTETYGPHHCFFLPQGTMHGFETTEQTNGKIVFFPKGCEQNLALPEDVSPLPLGDLETEFELKKLIEQLEFELTKTTENAYRASDCLGGLIAIWIDRQNHQKSLTQNNPSKFDHLVTAFSSLVEQDYQSGKNISEYAACLGISPTHLSRVCNSTCGKSALAIVQDRIHYEACRMLSDTKTPIKDIADTLGFKSAAYFTRAFHKQTGATPSQFRKTG